MQTTRKILTTIEKPGAGGAMGVRVHSKDYVLRTRCVVESAKNFLSAAQDWGAGAIKIGEHCIKCRTLNCSNCGDNNDNGRRRVPAEIAEELRNAFVRELEMTKVMDVDKRLTAVNRGLFCQALSALVIFLAHDEACRLAPAGQSAAPAEAVTDHQSHRREQDHHL